MNAFLTDCNLIPLLQYYCLIISNRRRVPGEFNNCVRNCYPVVSESVSCDIVTAATSESA